MNLNENPHHLHPEKQNAMYHFANHPMYHQNAYSQPCPMFIDHTKHSSITVPAHNAHVIPHNTQAIAHHIQVTNHHTLGTAHNTSSTVHYTQATAHNTQTAAHNIQTAIRHTQAVVHNTQAPAHHNQVTAHNTQPVTHNTQPIAHISQTTINNPQTPVHTTQSTANGTQATAHKTQSEVVLEKETQLEPQNKETLIPAHKLKAEVKADPETPATKSEKRSKAVGKSKNSVDTSHFTIEERLIAAVWVHERKNIKKSMRQLKHDFHQRFGRKAPAKNTLLGWERKLFSTGCLEDAPRTGRPVKRRSRVEEVAASIRAAPALSLRARALALRVPTTTLHTILRRDLAQPAPAARPPRAHDGKNQAKKSNKKAKPVKRKANESVEQAAAGPPDTRDMYTEALALSLC